MDIATTVFNYFARRRKRIIIIIIIGTAKYCFLYALKSRKRENVTF
jgi:hypothetical protein